MRNSLPIDGGDNWLRLGGTRRPLIHATPITGGDPRRAERLSVEEELDLSRYQASLRYDSVVAREIRDQRKAESAAWAAAAEIAYQAWRRGSWATRVANRPVVGGEAA